MSRFNSGLAIGAFLVAFGMLACTDEKKPCVPLYTNDAYSNDSAITRHILNMNGLQNVDVNTVLIGSTSEEGCYGIVMSFTLPDTIKKFNLGGEIGGLKLVQDIFIKGGLDTLPIGIKNKSDWKVVYVRGSMICHPTHDDSLFLAEYDTLWYKNQRCH